MIKRYLLILCARSAKRQVSTDECFGSETPAEKRARHRDKEPPDKYIPCRVCDRWECDNRSNQMLICDVSIATDKYLNIYLGSLPGYTCTGYAETMCAVAGTEAVRQDGTTLPRQGAAWRGADNESRQTWTRQQTRKPQEDANPLFQRWSQCTLSARSVHAQSTLQCTHSARLEIMGNLDNRISISKNKYYTLSFTKRRFMVSSK